MDKKTLSVIVLAVVVILFGQYYFNYSKKISPTLGQVDYPVQSKAATSTFKTVGATDTLVLATSTGNTQCNQFIEIVNDGSKTIYLSLNGDAPSIAGSGFMLSASSTYTSSSSRGNLYFGAIRAISPAGNENITLQCF